jgi:hypothetical protein
MVQGKVDEDQHNCQRKAGLGTPKKARGMAYLKVGFNGINKKRVPMDAETSVK